MSTYKINLFQYRLLKLFEYISIKMSSSIDLKTKITFGAKAPYFSLKLESILKAKSILLKTPKHVLMLCL